MNKKRYVVGLVNGEVLVQGGRSSDPGCCNRCGAGTHPGRRCNDNYQPFEAYEGHRGDES